MKTTKNIILSLLSMIGLTSFTCDDEKRPDYKVSVNDTIQISLPYTAGTGYMWFWNKDEDSLLDSVSVETNYNTELVGGAGTQVWNFVAKKTGKCTLEFEYKRPWEQGEGMKKEFTVKVK